MVTTNSSGPNVQPNSERASLLAKIPGLTHDPNVGLSELREVAKVIPALPKLTFPIQSSGELLAQLGPKKATFQIENIAVSPARMIGYIPASYFPISSMENFVEKMAALIQQNRSPIDVPKESAALQAALQNQLKFPINTRGELIQALKQLGRPVLFQGKPINLDTIQKRIPDAIFPITTEAEFFQKTSNLMTQRPLIVSE